MILATFLLLIFVLESVAYSTSDGNTAPPSPEVRIRNGTLIGSHDAARNQDFFLGIPYAKPPIDALRFNRPQPLAQRWSAPQDASKYGPSCLGVGVALVGYDQNTSWPQSEDCLTINVVRPSRYSSHVHPNGLPVLVWVYGGGFQEGYSGDPRYNFSRLVRIAEESTQPIIGVSFNYRTGILGFGYGSPFLSTGTANLGIHDQRMAFHWIHENIASFGGDPKRVTLFGESAGALSIGLNLLANNGTDDDFFHGAIMESGNPFFAHSFPTASDQDKVLDAVLERLNCTRPVNALTCLRGILAQHLVSVAGISWRPVIDNDLFTQLPSNSLSEGAFIKIPILVGTNTNEGTTFLDAYRQGQPVNTLEDVRRVLQISMAPFVLPNKTIDDCYRVYSGLSSNASEAQLGTVISDPGPHFGQLFGQTSLILGDSMFNAGRRATCQAWAKQGVAAYSYRFDTNPATLDPKVYGSAHFSEVSFVFANSQGIGYESNPFNVQNMDLKLKYLRLSNLMAKMWISFAQTGSPDIRQSMHSPRCSFVIDFAIQPCLLHKESIHGSAALTSFV